MNDTNKTLAEVMEWRLEHLIGLDPEPHGWWYCDNKDEPQMFCWGWQPRTDIVQAMMVAEKLRTDRKARYRIKLWAVASGNWLCEMQRIDATYFRGEGETPAEAICAAAMKTREGK